MGKAQIKMFETIAVLIVFFFLLITGAAFYFNMQKSSAKREFARLSEMRSMQVVQRASYLPELDCSFVSVQKDNCFDILKAKQLGKMLSQQNTLAEYFQHFGFSRITVFQAYPEPGFSIVLYSNALPEYRQKLVTQSPVLLYNATSQSYSFGVVEVEVYA